MKKKKLIATVLSASMLVGLLAGCGSSTDPAESPTGGGETTPAQGETTPAQNDVDYANFVIDPAQIPQEKLDTTLYLAVSVRGLENPYIATINEGMKLFAEYLDSIGQKYEMQVLDSQGDSAKEVDNMRQFAAMANGNAIAYADPNEDTIAYSLAEAMAESGGYLGTAWNKPADVGPADLTPNWVIHTSPDNVVNGYNIAKALFDSMGGSGQIFVVEGLLGNTANLVSEQGNPQMASALTSMSGALGNVARGVFITTSSFNSSAVDFASRYPHATIVLIDGQKLSELMIKYDLGVTIERSFQVKRLDIDYFEQA